MGFFDRFKSKPKTDSANAQWEHATGAKTKADKAYEKATKAKRTSDIKPKKPKTSKSKQPAKTGFWNDQNERVNRAMTAFNAPMGDFNMDTPQSSGKKKRGRGRNDDDAERMMRGDFPGEMGGFI